MKDVHKPHEKLALKLGETVFFYTDGVREPKNKKTSNLVWINYVICLKKMKNRWMNLSLIWDMEKSIQKFTGKVEQFDDLTVLTFKVL